MNRFLFWVIAGAVFIGCSSDGGKNYGESKNGGGSAGSRGTLSGAQGDLTLVLQSPATGMPTCPVTGRTYVIGDPDGPDGNSTPGDRLIDGMKGASISCSVLGTGTFSVSGSIRGTTAQGDLVVLKISDGTIDAAGQTGTATVSVNTTQLAATYQSTPGGCTLRIVMGNIKPGSIWGTVSCPSVVDPSSSVKSCAIGPTSAFVLENCDGS